MQTGYILGFFILPIFLEGCCDENYQKKKTGLRQDAVCRHYKAVEGEIFMMPCIESVNMEVVCSRTGEGREGNKGTSFVCGRKFLVEAKYSGKYTCRSLLSSGSELFFHLQVVERISLGPGCFQPEEIRELVVNIGGKIPCPGLNCSNNTDVIWYKGMTAVSRLTRSTCQEDGWLHLCKVRKTDTDVFFCDRQINESGVIWTFRRAVNVSVIPDEASYPPRIVHPENNTKEKVELGQCHTLMCKVYFPFEKKFSREVQWYMNYSGNTENMTLLPMEEQQHTRISHKEYKVIRRAIIKEVTPQHLNYRYTCIAGNNVGTSSRTIQLVEKIKVKWPSLVGYPIVSLLLVAGLGTVLHVKWLEIQLIYRSRFQHGKQHGGEKEFDVFLSYVWSSQSAELEGVLTLSPQRGPDSDEEACLSSMDPPNTEEGKSTQRPLEVLLPRVLEDWWGYRLCLLERDVPPGGAYTNDVVLAIKRSQMLICLLSADYLSNNNAVFELESGIQALLQNSSLKLLLIWTSGASASLIQPDPPLPPLVQRALKVLPSLDWTSGKPARATSNFWRSLRKAMPDQRVKLSSLMQDQ
ncbi:interleukin-18 receptor accessory protein-like isoform X3 [Sebastes umbrosus]|uniref:interleukin-18 receptor accessory protein-like isoform X3 n=1 Tax=Sebastes umbrosus TaxID=72105 RepID=UPI0018A04B37|nr:interleukin-18 receptor accessory protein-like isoform X3 [Sebastes umbrosus]